MPTQVGPLEALASFRDGRFLLGGAGGVELWDLPGASRVQGWDWGLGRITAVAVHPNRMVAAAGNDRGQVVVWDLDD